MTRSKIPPVAAVLAAIFAVVVAAATPLPGSAVKAAEEGERPPIPQQLWSFSGILGKYDDAALRRGFLVYMDA